MSNIITFYSFRHGVGKSTLLANLAVLLAREGRRVGVADMGFAGPGLHTLLGLKEEELHFTLNDFFGSQCEITQAAYDLTARLNVQPPGLILLMPASPGISNITRMERSHYELDRVHEGLRTLVETHHLDVLLLDTIAGLSQGTLISIAAASTLLIVLRQEQPDFQGTAVTEELARKLGVPRLFLVLNDVHVNLDVNQAVSHLKESYGCDEAAVLPHCEEIMLLASGGLLAVKNPDHPFVILLKQIAAQLVA